MNKRWKRSSQVLAILSVGAALLGTAFYCFVILPNERFRDHDWMSNASEDELRQNCHCALLVPVGNTHDASIALIRIGNADSVPLLIRALWYIEPRGTDKSMWECTRSHCVDALRSLTDEKHVTYAEWSQWWEAEGRHRDRETFFPHQDYTHVAQDVFGRSDSD
ncbi:MAG: hypothetical protein JSS27_14125 [Planctomycetes bacterium]|nr:hypothetical protein [Planctomycetota bacterium]